MLAKHVTHEHTHTQLRGTLWSLLLTVEWCCLVSTRWKDTKTSGKIATSQTTQSTTWGVSVAKSPSSVDTHSHGHSYCALYFSCILHTAWIHTHTFRTCICYHFSCKIPIGLTVDLFELQTTIGTTTMKQQLSCSCIEVKSLTVS